MNTFASYILLVWLSYPALKLVRDKIVLRLTMMATSVDVFLGGDDDYKNRFVLVDC